MNTLENPVSAIIAIYLLALAVLVYGTDWKHELTDLFNIFKKSVR
jgi:hypothetical protein